MYVEPLRFTTRRIRRVTFVNAGEMVSQQCLARTKLGTILTILLAIQTVTDRQMQDDHRRGQLMFHVQGTGPPHRFHRRLIQRLVP